MKRLFRPRIAGALVVAAALACGSGGAGPTDVPFGKTAFVVVMNPTVNFITQTAPPSPGAARTGVSIFVDQGPTGVTDIEGIAILGPVEPGSRTLSFSGAGGASGLLTAPILEGELRELAVSLDALGPVLMTEIRYAFDAEVVEITPNMSVEEVNEVLAQSDIVVFIRAGIYTGDLEFSGSDVTLFGEGIRGGDVTLTGNVTVTGSRNRIRGALIGGNLDVSGSNFGMSFSRVSGGFTMSGSGAVLLQNRFCGFVFVTGSGATALGNPGLAPLQPQGC